MSKVDLNKLMRDPKSIGAITLAVLVIVMTWMGFSVTGHPPALVPPKQDWDALLIKDVMLLSMVEGDPEVVADQDVLISNGQIIAVGDNLSVQAREMDNLEVWQGEGRFLLPGLIDSHVHLWDETELAGYLANGVTSIRNMSGMPWHLPLISRLEAGRLLGPSVMTTGPILNSQGPNQQDHHIIVNTEPEAREAVRDQYSTGFRHLKLYSNLTRQAYEGILSEASELGLTVSGHTPEGHRGAMVPYDEPFEISFLSTLDDGFVTIEHVESIAWHGLSDQLDLTAMTELADRIAESGTAVTATLIAHDNLVRVAESDGQYLDRPGTDTLNPVISRLEQGIYEYWSSQDPEDREGPKAEFYREATRVLHEAGVPILAGSDAGIFTNLPGSSLIRELELLVASGLSEHEALRAATVLPADILGWHNRGQIAPGYRADLVIVRSNPIENITNLENTEAVMINGIWLTGDALDDIRDASTQSSELRTWRRLIEMRLAHGL